VHADDEPRARAATYPMPSFPTPAFSNPPDLADATVAVVTTAGLMRHGDSPWAPGEPAFRTFGRDEDDLIVGHISTNFDRTGLAADRNVFYPLDRLRELEGDRTIGAVADRHISFMGAVIDLSTIILDTGPAAAQQLLRDGVDVVVITPVCPLCTRTVCTLAHVLEASGLATVAISLVEPVVRVMQPPRALHCQFPLGRPFGRPLDPPFQRSVLTRALGLLASPGPVIDVYPEIIDDEADDAYACTLPPRFDPSLPAAVDEARGLRPAYDRTVTQNGGRTQVGRRCSAADVPDALAKLHHIGTGAHWRSAGFADADALLNNAMDVRAYYEEAALALADHVPAARSVESWFFGSTAAGRVFLDAMPLIAASDFPIEKELLLAVFLPRSQALRSTEPQPRSST